MFDLLTSVFAICFFIGLLFSLISVIGGAGHFIGHSGVNTGHAGHFHAGDSHHSGSGDVGEGISFLNLSSLTVFITWFGAIGFSLRLYGGLGLWLVLILACIGGLIGAYIVYVFLVKFLLRGQSKPLNQADTYMPGTVAKVTSQINAGGAGEIVYVQLGTRRSCGAKAVDSSFIAKGTKVVVLKYERGIAFVKPCPELDDTAN
ncbi:MAG TPA: NfeD family protein [Desulfobacteria bacterium]|nr:NfeD family protein [Desulfobacteria bacterium]